MAFSSLTVRLPWDSPPPPPESMGERTRICTLMSQPKFPRIDRSLNLLTNGDWLLNSNTVIVPFPL